MNTNSMQSPPSSSNKPRFSRTFLLISLAAVCTLFAFSTTTILPSTTTSSQSSLRRSLSSLKFRIANNVADVTTPVQYSDTAVYWHIHKAGGTSMKRYYSCLDMVLSSHVGITEGHEHDKYLQVWTNKDGYRYVNVDTTKEIGILRAKSLKLAERHLADVVFVTYPALTTHIFQQQFKGRFFTMFRHPIERTVSEFYYRQVANWEPVAGVFNPNLAQQTIEEWLRDASNENEWNGDFMTAKLVGKAAVELTPDDLVMAKEFLRTKFLVGLVQRTEESVDRFDAYFGWAGKANREQCKAEYVRTPVNKNEHQAVENGSEAWNMLAAVNTYDLQLYAYAMQLFDEQAAMFPNLPKSIPIYQQPPPPPLPVEQQLPPVIPQEQPVGVSIPPPPPPVEQQVQQEPMT